MKYPEKFNLYRFLFLTGIGAACVITMIILCAVKQMYADEWFCIMIINLLFLAVFFYELENERVRGKLQGDTENNFFNPCIGFFICCGIGLAGMFFPEYLKPVMFIAMVMYAFTNEVIAISCGMFFSVIFCLYEGKSMNELAGYVFLILLSTVFFKALKKKNQRFYISMMYFCFQLLIPAIFYYWNYKIISYEVYIWGAGMGAGGFLFTFFAMGRIQKKVNKEEHDRYQELLHGDYREVEEVRAYSMMEYEHAKKVARLAGICAAENELNVDLCQAAGFYYRMGKRLGEPHVENGVLHAKQLCFPIPLQQILAEYNGEEEPISTPESAIVHMVDGLLVKVEALEKNVGKSKWNLEVMISQTLNEFSTSGLYDHSGLSMNQFLKTREVLNREVTKRELSV